jgi:hypothetical protein
MNVLTIELDTDLEETQAVADTIAAILGLTTITHAILINVIGE